MTLTIQDNRAYGEVETISIAVRDDNESRKIVSAFQHAGVYRITASSGGAGTVDAVGGITILGAVSTGGIFEGSVADYKLTGKFSGQNFSGVVSFGPCETKVSLRRKQ